MTNEYTEKLNALRAEYGKRKNSGENIADLNAEFDAKWAALDAELKPASEGKKIEQAAKKLVAQDNARGFCGCGKLIGTCNGNSPYCS